MRIVALAMSVLLVFSMPVRGQGQTDEYIIVPGKSVGKYSLNRTLTSYFEEFGANPRVTKDFLPGTDAYFWVEKGLVTWARGDAVIEIDLVSRALSSAYRDGDPQAVAIQRELERYRTAEGVGLGQPAERLKSLLGEPDYVRAYPESQFRIEGLIYKKRGGLYVEIESKATPGTVIRIGVFDPKTPNWL